MSHLKAPSKSVDLQTHLLKDVPIVNRAVHYNQDPSFYRRHTHSLTSQTQTPGTLPLLLYCHHICSFLYCLSHCPTHDCSDKQKREME